MLVALVSFGSMLRASHSGECFCCAVASESEKRMPIHSVDFSHRANDVQVFGPDPKAVEHAHRVIAAFAEADARGEGVALLDGRLLEHLHASEARRLISFAQAVALLEGNA